MKCSSTELGATYCIHYMLYIICGLLGVVTYDVQDYSYLYFSCLNGVGLKNTLMQYFIKILERKVMYVTLTKTAATFAYWLMKQQAAT